MQCRVGDGTVWQLISALYLLQKQTLCTKRLYTTLGTEVAAVKLTCEIVMNETYIGGVRKKRQRQWDTTALSAYEGHWEI